MQKALIYGAGNIGRGFIGQVFHDSGYEVVYIDVNMTVIDALNARGGYTLSVVSNEGEEETFIGNVRGVDGRDAQLIAQEIATADIMATSIGVNVLPRIAGNIAAGIKRRAENGNTKPLNIILCENLMDAAKHMRGFLAPYFEGELGGLLDQVGLVEVTIGRMVPALPRELYEADPTLIKVERFCTLPIDGSKFVGEIPKLAHAEFISPFKICEEKKLYLHNMSHALCAYFGYLKGYTFIWEAAQDEQIAALLRQATRNVARAIAQAYNTQAEPIYAFAGELLERYQNRRLGDPIARVARDPLRKLQPQDRLIGAINRCKSQGMDYETLLRGVAAALAYDAPDDPSAGIIRQRIEHSGVDGFIKEVCGLDEADAKKVVDYYRECR